MNCITTQSEKEIRITPLLRVGNEDTPHVSVGCGDCNMTIMPTNLDKENDYVLSSMWLRV
jgi:sugar (pentulose or hexulose) kinase